MWTVSSNLELNVLRRIEAEFNTTANLQHRPRYFQLAHQFYQSCMDTGMTSIYICLHLTSVQLSRDEEGPRPICPWAEWTENITIFFVVWNFPISFLSASRETRIHCRISLCGTKQSDKPQGQKNQREHIPTLYPWADLQGPLSQILRPWGS